MTDDKLYSSLSANTIMAKPDESLLTDQTCKRLITTDNLNTIHLTHNLNTIHLTLKMTSAQVVETPVINNSSFQNYPRVDDHTKRTNDTSGLELFARFSPEVKPRSYFLFILKYKAFLVNTVFTFSFTHPREEWNPGERRERVQDNDKNINRNFFGALTSII